MQHVVSRKMDSHVDDSDESLDSYEVTDAIENEEEGTIYSTEQSLEPYQFEPEKCEDNDGVDIDMTLEIEEENLAADEPLSSPPPDRRLTLDW